jgi:outer membrane protein assembly factor BamB
MNVSSRDVSSCTSVRHDRSTAVGPPTATSDRDFPSARVPWIRWIVAGLTGVLVLAAALALPRRTRRRIPIRGPVGGTVWPSGPSTTLRPPTPHLSRWLTSFCLADVNGDAVADPVGVGIVADESPPDPRFVALDGRTGEILWRDHATVPHSAWVLCPRRDTALLIRPDFTLEAIDSRTGRSRWSVTLSDTAEQGVAGPGCVTITSRDQNTAGLDLATGARVACPSTGQTLRAHAQLTEIVADNHEVTLGTVVYSVTSRQLGTPVLTVTAREKIGAAIRWERTLPIVATGAGNGYLFADASGLIVLGGDASRDFHLSLFALDPTTGATIRSSQPGSHLLLFPLIEGLAADHGMLFVQSVGSLAAIEVATGRQVWHTGH